jgi:hypothetical protein
MKTSRKYLKKRRKHIKSSRKKRGGNISTIVIFSFNSKIGFFSQFWFLCQSYIYAKNNNYAFFVDSSKWNYKSKYGWHDYFTSLNEYKDDMTQKNIKRFSHQNNTGIPDYKIRDYIDAVQEIYKLNDTLLAKIKEYVDQHKPYNSLYIRRGDKVAENPMDPIREILGFTDLKDTTKTLFVQTDDYSVIVELQQLLPFVKIITITPEKMKGSYQGQVLEVDDEKRKEDTEKFLISIGIFLQGDQCWTDIRSNVGRFHKISNFTKVKYYPDNKDHNINKDITPWFHGL